MSPFELVVDIAEHGRRVVRHSFYGETKRQAESYYIAHLKSDRFLRECVEKGCFDGRVPCGYRIFWRVYQGVFVTEDGR